MSKPSLWSDEQSGHSWLPAAEPTTADHVVPATEEHTPDRPTAERVRLPTLLIVACVVGTATAALVEMLR
jgi:hypothetical protein